jgi:hypothetical protein
MKPGPKKIAEIIQFELFLDAPPEPLDELVYRVIINHPEWQFDPDEKAKVLTPKIEKILSDSWKRSIGEGKQPRYSFNSVSSYKIQGACFIEPCDPPEIKDQKRRRLHWKDYYEHLKKLSPEEFEILCAKVLALLGVPKPYITPYRIDQGIDFYGKISIGDLTGHGPLFPVFESDILVWMVGQAKHYLYSKVATPDIRALVGSATLGRTRTFSRIGALPGLEIRPCDPIVMMFFTTGDISTEGWFLCRSAGIAAMNGEMLGAFLADKEIGLIVDGDMKKFDSNTFKNWIDIK